MDFLSHINLGEMFGDLTIVLYPVAAARMRRGRCFDGSASFA